MATPPTFRTKSEAPYPIWAAVFRTTTLLFSRAHFPHSRCALPSRRRTFSRRALAVLARARDLARSSGVGGKTSKKRPRPPHPPLVQKNRKDPKPPCRPGAESHAPPTRQ